MAGAVALLLEARPHLSPNEVQQRLQNTARPSLWWASPALGFFDNVHRQGAGMLSVDDAVLADATVWPSSLALGEIESGTVTRRLRISKSDMNEWRKRHGRVRRHHHDDDETVTYTIGHEVALATGANTFAPSFLAAFATATFSEPIITIGGRGHHDDSESILVGQPGAHRALELAADRYRSTLNRACLP